MKIKKTLAKLAYNEAVRSANTGCPFFLYQLVEPEKVKKLRKF